jgi:hypothetical protein
MLDQSDARAVRLSVELLELQMRPLFPPHVFPIDANTINGVLKP